MPADPMTRVTRTNTRFVRAREAFEAASAERRQAIIAAYEAGVSLNRLAEALGVTHEAVRQMVRAHDGQVRPYRRSA